MKKVHSSCECIEQLQCTTENMLRRWQKYAGDRNDLCRSRRKEDWVAGNRRRRTETSANTYLRGKGRTYDDDISGSHGAEYIGVQALSELSRELDPKDTAGNVICLHVANPSAFRDYVRFFVPEDEKI